ncbi:MAG TPA: M48 family metalloprotease [Alphaproteobacteria bacterium]
MIRKSLPLLALTAALSLSACSTNEATGRSQFTGLMPTSQEISMGSGLQAEAEKTFGVYDNAAVQAYVDRICDRLLPGVERRDVTYTCTVLDSPVINAFALPGGYININRGLLAFANSEAEVASVLAHEMGHVTARHISERYSQSTLTQLGAAALSVSLGSKGANQLIGLGANAWLASYSRSQESESDELGIRYMNRAGYDPMAMSTMLAGIQRASQLEASEEGEDYKEMKSFMSTHPLTSERVAHAAQVAGTYPDKGTAQGIGTHLNAIAGLVYGDSPKDGYVRGSEFIHPQLGFAFAIPQGFTVKNTPQQVIGVARSGSGAAFAFDSASKPAGMDPATYIQQSWTKGQAQLSAPEDINVSGMRGATVQTQGTVNGKAALMRLVAVEWSPSLVYRFQFAMPQATSNAEIEALKGTTYSLRRITSAEASNVQPRRIQVVTAGGNDSVASLSNRMPFNDGLNEMRFRAINALTSAENVQAGRKYKIVVQ